MDRCFLQVFLQSTLPACSHFTKSLPSMANRCAISSPIWWADSYITIWWVYRLLLSMIMVTHISFKGGLPPWVYHRTRFKRSDPEKHCSWLRLEEESARNDMFWHVAVKPLQEDQGSQHNIFKDQGRTQIRTPWIFSWAPGETNSKSWPKLAALLLRYKTDKSPAINHQPQVCWLTKSTMWAAYEQLYCRGVMESMNNILHDGEPWRPCLVAFL